MGQHNGCASCLLFSPNILIMSVISVMGKNAFGSSEVADAWLCFGGVQGRVGVSATRAMLDVAALRPFRAGYRCGMAITQGSALG